MSALKVYVDLMSQPSRALLMFLKMTNIPFEQKIVSIAKMEHKEPAFKDIHKFGKIPAVVDGNTSIIESVAILKYLCRKYEVQDHWYPRDLVSQVRVDEFLEWQHIGLRVPCASYFMAEFLTPMFTGKPASSANLERLKKPLEESLGNMENVWLKNNSYVTGNNITIADLLGLCEIEQLHLTSYNPYANRPNLTAWANRLHSDLKPHYDKTHKIFNKVMLKTKGQGSKL